MIPLPTQFYRAFFPFHSTTTVILGMLYQVHRFLLVLIVFIGVMSLLTFTWVALRSRRSLTGESLILIPRSESEQGRMREQTYNIPKQRRGVSSSGDKHRTDKPCSIHSDCHWSFICVDGRCTKGCETSRDCIELQYCGETGQCMVRYPPRQPGGDQMCLDRWEECWFTDQCCSGWCRLVDTRPDAIWRCDFL